MKKLSLTLLFFFLFAGICFGGKPTVRFNKIVVSGVNVSITTKDAQYGVFSNMFARLRAGEHYKIVINSEQDLPHICRISRVSDDGIESPYIGEPFAEPGIWFTPAHDAIYSVRCLTAPDQIDLIGIVVEEE